MGYHSDLHISMLEAKPFCHDGCNCTDCRRDHRLAHELATMGTRTLRDGVSIPICPECGWPMDEEHTPETCAEEQTWLGEVGRHGLM